MKEPQVKLVNAFSRPYDNFVATARTCYSSKGIITAEDAAGETAKNPDIAKRTRERSDAIAQSIYQAGHHTTLQHAHFQFALTGISRQFIWSFLHSHPYYNSEQVSQRYVEVKSDNFVVPPLTGLAREHYLATVEWQMSAYKELVESLTPVAAAEFYNVFPGRRGKEKYDGSIQKKSQEVARYVLPLATGAYMYHSISGLTLLRYWRLCNMYDSPWEQKLVVGRMVEELLNLDPNYAKIIEEPLEPEALPEYEFFLRFQESRNGASKKSFLTEFDESLKGNVSRLIDWKLNNESVLASSVREVFGVSTREMNDESAIRLSLDPSQNHLFGESLNVTTLGKLSRALFHPHYTFRKKISHTADSQDQRHRMTPASRPVLAAHCMEEPDYITPELVKQDTAIHKRYDDIMKQTWEASAKLKKLGASEEFAMYLLPNALSIRFTESADLLNLHHKLKSRLCYNSQEEIWRASVDETKQIRAINPIIGKYLLPPCGLRKLSGAKPFCPEGERFCGVPVWNYELERYERVI